MRRFLSLVNQSLGNQFCGNDMSDQQAGNEYDEATEFASSDLAMDEIEAAYLRAMEATESMELLLPEAQLGDTDEAELEKTNELPSDESAFEETSPTEIEPEEQPQATSAQVIEALLFVGSSPLPAKKIIEILGGSTTHEQVDLLIEQLNETYLSQSRPYEFHLVEGGYRMALKPEFEQVRRRVYGQGPKDVKLNQESLEVLAFVAYQQPASRTRLEEIGKKNVGSLLRQLLRRQLIELERSEETNEENYKTTKRFLELFGLSSTDDLPQAMDFNFK
jgi:segregation and condensation protein B